MIGHNQHRNAGEFVSTVITGNLAVNTIETEVKLGSTILAERKLVAIINDSSYLIYGSYLPTFTIGGQHCYTIYSGNILEVYVDPNPPDGIDPAKFYIKVEEGATTVKIVEAS